MGEVSRVCGGPLHIQYTGRLFITMGRRWLEKVDGWVGGWVVCHCGTVLGRAHAAAAREVIAVCLLGCSAPASACRTSIMTYLHLPPGPP